ncbi:hypothetical protein KDN32_06925 [Nocardioides sp. J2M5]|uniref:hypothetical protein n=1 Tax=Nocardioides palaemonis TaxID=2829810 RepID=UPI001BAC4553|nr:hypothetical protein [Nocardioides palaemonis]MBS2937471.1 hypothetical protein [Nocardioides palaemonis]
MAAPLISRRTTLGSALATPVLLPLALGGCDIDPPRAEPAPGQTAPPPEDSALVASVVAELVRAEAVVAAAVAAVPSLAERLAPVADAHAAHREVLAGAVPDADLPTAEPVTVAPRIVPALRTVGRSEQRLLRAAREACLVAASGDLARVLASVAASTSQHAAALSTEVVS